MGKHDPGPWPGLYSKKVYTGLGQLQSTQSDTFTVTRNEEQGQGTRQNTNTRRRPSRGDIFYGRVCRAIYLGTPAIGASRDRNHVKLVNNKVEAAQHSTEGLT